MLLMEAQDRWAYYAKKPDVSKCEDDTRWITVVGRTEKKKKYINQKVFFFTATILWNL